MHPVLKIMHMLNFLDTFSMGITVCICGQWTLGCFYSREGIVGQGYYGSHTAAGYKHSPSRVGSHAIYRWGGDSICS